MILPKGTIIRRVIRGKERFYHQWREDGKTKSRYLKPAEVMPLREQLGQTRAVAASATGAHQAASASPHPLFSAGLIQGLRLRELTADAKRLTPRELLPDLLGTGPSSTGTVPFHLIVGAPGTGKTTLLKHVLLTFSDSKLKQSAYLSLPATLTAPELLADLATLFDAGIRNFFLDGLDRSPALAGTLPVLADLYPSRGARLYLTATAPSTAPSTSNLNLIHSNLNLISTTRISFRDFCAMSRTDDLDAYLASRGLAAELAAHEPTSRHLGAAARKLARDKIRRELAEAKLRDVILEETRLRRTTETSEVLVPELSTGGVDMIVVDHEELTCELYEIRYAAERDDRQIARLENARNLDAIEHRYGMITTREVLYLGRNAWHHNGIFYRNAAAYLRTTAGG